MERFDEVLAEFRERSKQNPRKYAYGTAGFRGRYDEDMHCLFTKVGIIAAIRSLCISCKCIGVMITASHNLEMDNGVKIVDFDGGMLEYEWEVRAEELVNDDIDTFTSKIKGFLKSFHLPNSNIQPVVMLGMDTRSHSPILVNYVRKGISVIANGISFLLGEVTTPTLHFAVMAYNTHPDLRTSDKLLTHYFQTLFSGYQQLIRTATTTTDNKAATSFSLMMDAAYGVGSVTMEAFLAYVAKLGDNNNNNNLLFPWQITIVNKARHGPVNENCGAEHAQKLRMPPVHCEDGRLLQEKLLTSFDGDGDRIVFHYYCNNNNNNTVSTPIWILLDGDRIAALFATFLHKELTVLGLISANNNNNNNNNSNNSSSSNITMGIVQTAYANGSSTAYLRSLGIPVVMAKTGVKYLHHKAQELDVGVYFEANGHGTVLFSSQFRYALSKLVVKEAETRKKIALARLEACLALINPTVGDAMSDLLTTMAILTVQEMSWSDWDAMYTELPSKQTKVSGITNKYLLKCSEDETYLLEPRELQEKIDAIAKTVKQGRCFIRPSGTEDVVRIYAEAETMREVDLITSAVEGYIRDYFK